MDQTAGKTNTNIKINPSDPLKKADVLDQEGSASIRNLDQQDKDFILTKTDRQLSGFILLILILMAISAALIGIL